LSNLKCTCGSENVECDVAVSNHQDLFLLTDNRELIRAFLCKDCGAVHFYVKNPDKKYYNREDKINADKLYYAQKKNADSTAYEKTLKHVANRLYMFIIVAALVLFFLSRTFFCTDSEYLQRFAFLTCAFSPLVAVAFDPRSWVGKAIIPAALLSLIGYFYIWGGKSG
jgi:hypothetical protein